MCLCVYIYIYIYIHTYREREMNNNDNDNNNNNNDNDNLDHNTKQAGAAATESRRWPAQERPEHARTWVRHRLNWVIIINIITIIIIIRRR